MSRIVPELIALTLLCVCGCGPVVHRNLAPGESVPRTIAVLPVGTDDAMAREKLTYDFYYLKQRNLLLDWVVAIKAWRIPFDVPTH